MAFSSKYGIELDLRNVPKTKELTRNDYVLFSESNSRFLVEVAEKHRAGFESLMKDVVCVKVGKVQKDTYLSVKGLDGKQVIHADLEKLRRRWKNTLGGT